LKALLLAHQRLMPTNPNSGQFEPDAPFKPPAPIAEGSDEARFASHRARFAGVKFDLAEFNRMMGFAAFKRWHKWQLDARDAE